MRKLIIATLAALMPVCVHAADKHDRIATLIAGTDGLTRQTAFKVKSVDEEYQVLAALGLKAEQQDLIMGDDGHPYDMLTAVDPRTGAKREVWFDIKSFFGKELGF